MNCARVTANVSQNDAGYNPKFGESPRKITCYLLLKDHFYDSLTCNSENNSPAAIDTWQALCATI